MSPRWLHWPAAAGTDWDTYEDGIYAFYWTDNGSQPVANSFYINETIDSSLSYDDVDTTGNTYVRRYLDDASLEIYIIGGSSLPSHIALWDTANSTWHLCTYRSFGSTSPLIYRYDISGTMPSSVGPPYEVMVMVYLTQDPGDISGWRNYDGTAPTL